MYRMLLDQPTTESRHLAMAGIAALISAILATLLQIGLMVYKPNLTDVEYLILMSFFIGDNIGFWFVIVWLVFTTKNNRTKLEMLGAHDWDASKYLKQEDVKKAARLAGMKLTPMEQEP